MGIDAASLVASELAAMLSLSRCCGGGGGGGGGGRKGVGEGELDAARTAAARLAAAAAAAGEDEDGGGAFSSSPAARLRSSVETLPACFAAAFGAGPDGCDAATDGDCAEASSSSSSAAAAAANDDDEDDDENDKEAASLARVAGALMAELERLLLDYLSCNWDSLDRVVAANAASTSPGSMR